MRNRNLTNLDTISIRLTTEEKQVLLERAEEGNLTLSEYVRNLLTEKNETVGKLSALPQELIIDPDYVSDMLENIESLKEKNPVLSSSEIIRRSLAMAADLDKYTFSSKIKNY